MLLVGAAPAAAHRPYFTQVEQVALPDGAMGEIRLLHGDGIIISDPVRAIIVDGDGRLRARSPQTWAMILLCPRQHQCRAVDLQKDLAYEIEPTTFQLGPVIPEGQILNLGGIESGKESWGFRSRHASFAEIVRGNFEFVRYFFVHHVVILVLLGAAAAGIPFASLRRPQFKETWKLSLWIGGLLVRIAFAAVFVIISIFWVGFFGGTGWVWLASISLGAALVFLFRASLMLLFVSTRMALR
jgi:hypothetical protein